MPKAVKKNPKTIEPEVSEGGEVKASQEKLRTVKFDNKRLDGLSEEDVTRIVSGAVHSLGNGSINKITIE